jgi:hypothetical protein
LMVCECEFESYSLVYAIVLMHEEYFTDFTDFTFPCRSQTLSCSLFIASLMFAVLISHFSYLFFLILRAILGQSWML